jgi:hypothetical protein
MAPDQVRMGAYLTLSRRAQTLPRMRSSTPR